VGNVDWGLPVFAAPECHHSTETLETVQFGVSNVPGSLLGPEISQVEGWPSWPSGLPSEAGVELLKGGRPTAHRAHASAALDTKPDHDNPETNPDPVSKQARGKHVGFFYVIFV
jgi:hypothetical protein